MTNTSIYPMGTVALVERDPGIWVAGLRGMAVDGSSIWRFADGTSRHCDRSVARPQVRLDPTDETQMRALQDALWHLPLDGTVGVVALTAAVTAVVAAMLPAEEYAIVTEEPLDPAARPVDLIGHEWARNRDGKWHCLTATRDPSTWESLVSGNFGPMYSPTEPTS